MSKKDYTRLVKLIANPGAGNAAEAPQNIELVVGALEKQGLKVDLVLANPSERGTRLAKRAVKDGYKLIVAMGGDGTIEAVMRGMLDSKVRLGIIPNGTRNNIAKSLGIPKNLEEACALIATDAALKVDMGQVTTRKGKKFFFFELATLGLSASLYPEANKIGDGKISNLRAAALTFIHHETRPKVFLTLDNESKIEVETMSIIVSNTPTFGENFLVAPHASLRDGLLDVSVYPDFSKAELLRYYAEVMDGGYSGDTKVQHYQARKVKIKASPKLDVMADGVALGNGSVKIKVRAGVLRVITTEKNVPLEKQPRGAKGRDVATTPEAKSSARQKARAQDKMRPAPASPTVGKNHREKSAVSPH